MAATTNRLTTPVWHLMAVERPPRSGVYLTTVGRHIGPGLWDNGCWSTLDRFQETLPLRDDGDLKPIDRWAWPPTTLDQLRRLIEAADAEPLLSARARDPDHPGSQVRADASPLERNGQPRSGQWRRADSELPRRSGVYLTKQGVHLLARLWDQGRWSELGRHQNADALGPITHWAPPPVTAAMMRAFVLAEAALADRQGTPIQRA